MATVQQIRRTLRKKAGITGAQLQRRKSLPPGISSEMLRKLATSVRVNNIEPAPQPDNK